jgi:ABC-type antimicrobial peptide transport system permease subunit
MQQNFRETPQPLVYLPLVHRDPRRFVIASPAFVVKSSRAEVMASDVRNLVHDVAPEAPMYRVYTMAFLARRAMLHLSFTMLTLGIAAVLALILGAVGLYGVLSYTVAERTREIGVRMALGAKATQVHTMIVAQGARVVGIGIVIGLAAAYVATKSLATLLFNVQAFDVMTFAGMAASMIAIGFLASYLPARRASSVDPIESLRGVE